MFFPRSRSANSARLTSPARSPRRAPHHHASHGPPPPRFGSAGEEKAATGAPSSPAERGRGTMRSVVVGAGKPPLTRRRGVAALLEHGKQVLPVRALAEARDEALELGDFDEAEVEGDFLGAADLRALALLQSSEETRGVDKGV